MTPKSVITNRATQTDKIFRDIVSKEKAAQDAKTARLKALRLAQTAETERAAAEAPPKTPVKPKARKSVKARPER